MNPFSDGGVRVVQPPPTALVIFGATGDLTHRKLVPALYDLFRDNHLPERFIVIGASRSEISDEEFRTSLVKGTQSNCRGPFREEVWAEFTQKLFFQPTNGDRVEDFRKLKERLTSLERSIGEDFNYLYYLAVAPDFFGPIFKHLREAGLIESPREGLRRTAAVVEKPFGHDVRSAQALNALLKESFAEQQTFRIDHYLGKETVQNILVLRFLNGIFEPLWNRKYIDQIQISVCEEIGVGKRAGYFDSAGIMRDIVQNHVLQVLALLCIEPPVSLSDADSIRDEKVKVLRSMRRFTREEVRNKVVRAQYDAGHINGDGVIGYRAESGVREGSMTETFVALQLSIDNWRWDGVPIYVRAGKRLPKRMTEIAVYFKGAPRAVFGRHAPEEYIENVLTIQVQPDEAISLRMGAKAPGPFMRVRPVEMDFAYDESFGVASPAAYERLLLDAMKGDNTLFTRADEIEEAWSLLAPVFSAWDEGNEACPLHTYAAGSWGPKAAGELLTSHGHRWRRL